MLDNIFKWKVTFSRKYSKMAMIIMTGKTKYLFRVLNATSSLKSGNLYFWDSKMVQICAARKLSVFKNSIFKYRVKGAETVDESDNSATPIKNQSSESRVKVKYVKEHEPNTVNNNNNNSRSLTSLDLLSLNTNIEAPRHESRYKPYQKVIHVPPVKGEIIYGIHPISIAIESKRREFHALYYKIGTEDSNERIRNLIQKCESQNIPSYSLELNVLNRLANALGTHQGICADVSKLKVLPYTSESSSLEEGSVYSASGGDSVTCASLSKHKVWLVLLGIQDPMNFGSVLRTAYYFGVDRILVGKENSCRLSPVVSKASSGVLELLSVYSIADIKDFILKKHLACWEVVGTVISHETKGKEMMFERPLLNISNFDTDKPVVIVFGGEGCGIPSDILQMCSTLLTVSPQQELHPKVDSLNVSAAAAVVLYGISQRLQKS